MDCVAFANLQYRRYVTDAEHVTIIPIMQIAELCSDCRDLAAPRFPQLHWDVWRASVAMARVSRTVTLRTASIELHTATFDTAASINGVRLTTNLSDGSRA
jgi:hypothetical protein